MRVFEIAKRLMCRDALLSVRLDRAPKFDECVLGSEESEWRARDGSV